MTQRIVIIGAGMASGRLLDHLVASKADIDVTLFNAEPRGTYNRIMLSPVLSGEKSFADIVTHDGDWYRRNDITCHFGTQVIKIDRTEKTVSSAAGSVAYDRLVLATGSSPFIIPVPGHDLSGVVSYRDLDDTNAMIDAAAKGGSAVVIGGGLLGLEAAAGLAARGMAVTVLHLMDHLMERQLDAAAAELLRRDLEAKGIGVKCNAVTKAIHGDGQVTSVELESGECLPADLVVMAVGIRPETTLAREAGVEVGRGVTIDSHMRTSDPDIYALGECVELHGQLFGLVAPLYDQAEALAACLTGTPQVFTPQELATKLKVTGCDLFSAGDFAQGDGREDIVFRDPARGVYRRLVIRKNCLIGAVMYGDTESSNWFFRLIRDKTDISDMRDTLVFGPAFQNETSALTAPKNSDKVQSHPPQGATFPPEGTAQARPIVSSGTV